MRSRDYIQIQALAIELEKTEAEDMVEVCKEVGSGLYHACHGSRVRTQKISERARDFQTFLVVTKCTQP